MSNYTINNPATLINGLEFGWSSINLSFPGGYNIIGVTEISYEENLNKEPLYGKGSKPVAYGTGNHGYTGSVTVYKSEFDRIELAAQIAGDITSLHTEPFSVTIMYRNLGDTKITTERLTGVTITNISNSAGQGDTGLLTTLTFFFTDMERVII